MEIKIQKIKKAKIKNSFIDVILIFKYDFWYVHKINEEQIKNVNRFVRFENKSLCQKEEILLNDYLKKELRKNVELWKAERLKIDITIDDKNLLVYDKINNLVGFKKFNEIDDDYIFRSCTITSKRLTKKICDENENRFSIYIVHTKRGLLRIGLVESNFINFWCYYCGCMTTCRYKSYHIESLPFNKIKAGDIISLTYCSKKGTIKLEINGTITGTCFTGLNVKEDYRFVLTLFNEGDTIEIIE